MESWTCTKQAAGEPKYHFDLLCAFDAPFLLNDMA
jgi:hypothetical protein